MSVKIRRKGNLSLNKLVIQWMSASAKVLIREKGSQMSFFRQGEYQTGEAIAKYPLPQPHVRWADAIAKWIDVTVPCVTSNEQSQAVTDMVVKHLRRTGVSDMVIAEALSKSVYKYSYMSTATSNLQILVPLHEQQSHQTSIGVARPHDPEQDKFRARELDASFQVAKNAHNVQAMETIAKLLLDLLFAHGRAKQAKAKNDALAAEILLNAPNIARVIRVVGPKPPVPGPDGRTLRRVGPNTYALDEDRFEIEADGEAEGEAEVE